MRKMISCAVLLLFLVSLIASAQAAAIVDRRPVTEKLIAVTLEDIERSEDLQMVLSLCREQNAKLTFFLQVAVIAANPSLVKQAVADGHEFGNHGLKHRYWGDAEKREIVEELAAADAIIRPLAGPGGRLLVKPPYNYYEAPLIDAVGQFSPQAVIIRGEDVADWLDASPQAVLEKVQKLTGNGVILNLNFNVKNGAAALPALLTQLKDAGYRLVTITELTARAVRDKSPVVDPSVRIIPLDVSDYGVINRLPTDRPEIALTFDDGGRPGKVETILEQLRQNGVKATFFLLGGWVSENPDIVRRIWADGHEIANHSYSHPDFSWLDAAAMQREVIQTSEGVQNVTGGACAPYFRPPYGSYNSEVIQTIKKLGYALVMWTIDTRDWTGASASQVAETVIQEAGPGSIVLFHLHGKNTAEALSILLPKLRSAGYRMRTISEILQN